MTMEQEVWKLAHFESNTVTYGINRNSITKDWNNTVNELAINPLQVSKNTYKKHLKTFLLDSLI